MKMDMPLKFKINAWVPKPFGLWPFLKKQCLLVAPCSVQMKWVGWYV